eukprot:TRINITY_DN9722_c0_g1_i2.p1 TRINITY_DN9722_c0_g1~~TRINITY_DN9722_c0_g1_i2.p1  ORF type:complete len:495 (+),score=57.92 TRINITY_DN9722_c0_g1_i2:48-1487(+)
MPAAGTPAFGAPASRSPFGAPGTPGTTASGGRGSLHAGAPAVGTPAVGTPAVGTPAVGTPAVGTPAVGTVGVAGAPTVGTAVPATPAAAGAPAPAFAGARPAPLGSGVQAGGLPGTAAVPSASTTGPTLYTSPLGTPAAPAGPTGIRPQSAPLGGVGQHGTAAASLPVGATMPQNQAAPFQAGAQPPATPFAAEATTGPPAVAPATPFGGGSAMPFQPSASAMHPGTATTSLPPHPGLASAALNPNPHGNMIELNVGGKFFTTTLDTLQKYERSALAQMFRDPIAAQRDPQGRYFLDRNGLLFSHVLDFLRNGAVVGVSPHAGDLIVQLSAEMAHFGLPHITPFESLFKRSPIGPQLPVIASSAAPVPVGPGPCEYRHLQGAPGELLGDLERLSAQGFEVCGYGSCLDTRGGLWRIVGTALMRRALRRDEASPRRAAAPTHPTSDGPGPHSNPDIEAVLARIRQIDALHTPLPVPVVTY